MKRHFVLILLSSLLFISCKKENADAALQMRIRNNTFSRFSYSYATGTEFGKIATGATTVYKSFKSISDIPAARVVVDADTLFAGYYYFCATLPTPLLEDGKYTLEIFEDSISVPGFLSARFIKD